MYMYMYMYMVYICLYFLTPAIFVPYFVILILTTLHSVFLFFQQASDTTLVSGSHTEHLFGWMDDIAFYNRVLTVDEISKNWQKAINTDDPSLFLYYNFDDGPGSDLIKNLGKIGAQGNLYNGQILGSSTYLETNSQTLMSVTRGIFSPGVPLIGASNSLPVVFAVDAGASARLRITCQLTATTTTASLIPSTAKLVTLPSGTGKIYQADTSKTRITTSPTVLSNTAAEFWYHASATTNTSVGTSVIDSMQFSCVCNGETQTGIINVIINPAVVADPTISLVAVSGTTTNFNLHGSLVNPGLMKVNITSLPTLGYLSQWNLEQPDLTIPILKVSQSDNQSIRQSVNYLSHRQSSITQTISPISSFLNHLLLFIIWSVHFLTNIFMTLSTHYLTHPFTHPINTLSNTPFQYTL